tara:strand:- start:35062 stop:35166 length:105 start_codon:yes stop_codon:yes gene_type:complete
MKEFVLVVIGFIFGAAIGVSGITEIGSKIINLFG